MVFGIIAKLLHPTLGQCELIRVEGTNWIVAAKSSGVHYRIPPEKRAQFQVVQEASVPASQPNVETSQPQPEARSKSSEAQAQPAEIAIGEPASDRLQLGVLDNLKNAGTSLGLRDSRHARRVIESLRIGLPCLDGSTRHLAVGFQETAKLIGDFLHEVDVVGGCAMTLKGAYGQGKTFSLIMLEDMARETGFVTVRTEIDATENRLNKPHHIYRDLMRNLRLPGIYGYGVRSLAEAVEDLLRQECPRPSYQRMHWLDERIGCFPLAWLLSDPLLLDKPPLVGLLGGDPNYPASHARNCHAFPPAPRYWPSFSAATQGDFASFVLSGIGRLVRLLGYRGLVVILDEMEKWYELNWSEQARAGNLLGGLIWGAVTKQGRRGMDDHPRGLTHSGRCGGYPFTTERRSHVGVAIAMTPRDHDESELLWSHYGLILLGHVPSLTERRLLKYCRLVSPFFAKAYGLSPPNDQGLQCIAAEALHIWRKHGDLNMRSGVQSAITAFDHWRDQN